MNALAEAITIDGEKVIANYNATGSANITTYDQGALRSCEFPRPFTDEAAMTRLLFSATNRDTCVSFAPMTAPYQARSDHTSHFDIRA